MGASVPSIVPVLSSVIGVAKNIGDMGKAKSSSSAQSALLAKQQQSDEQSRQRALRASMASQRARFGASGLTPEEGSAEAVLLGMFSESEAEAAARAERDALRQRAIDTNGGYTNGRNLLEATQGILGAGFSRTFLS